MSILTTIKIKKEKQMFKHLMIGLSIGWALVLSGCAINVPMDSQENDAKYKTFPEPTNGKAGLYIYRDSVWGRSYKKYLYIDGSLFAKTSNKSYIYTEVSPGTHQISTQSEFGNNSISFEAESGKTYFVRQYLKLGFIGEGANLKMVSEEEGKKGVLGTSKIKQTNKF